MVSTQARMGIAAMQVDDDLSAAQDRYPQGLPRTHISYLLNRGPRLKPVGGMLAGRAPDEWDRLLPLARQLEVNRAHAESSLVLDRAGEFELCEDDRERLTQRALGILPTEEWARLHEVASCAELSPGFLTGSPDRFLNGVAAVEQEMGQATALAYSFLLMAGIRSGEDLRKYGERIEELFSTVAISGTVQYSLHSMGGSGLASLDGGERVQLARAIHDRLWQLADVRAGRAFVLTQVLDGYLNLRSGGVGDDLGLAVADGIVAAKFGLAVDFRLLRGRVFLEVKVSEQHTECWDPFDRDAGVNASGARRLGIPDLLVLGYLRMARGYANAGSYAHGARVARWVLAADPECAEALVTLSRCQLGEESPGEAIDTCYRALVIDPGLAEACLVQGNAYSVMNRWPEAIERYKQAIRCRVGFAEAYNNLGLALQRNGELELAIGAYNEATRVRDDDYAEAWYNLGNLHFERAPTLASEEQRQVEYGLAVEAYRMAAKCAPDFAAALYNLGQAYYARKDLPAALAAYQAAVKANPKHAGAWHNLGIVYRDLGKPELAVEAIEKAVTLNPILLR